MRVLIRKSSQSPTGYELVVINDEGKETSIAIPKTYPNEPFTLVLPENPSNRKYFNSKKVEAAGGQIELTYKESKTFGQRTETTPRKGLEEYLNDEDKATYLALIEKAKKAREEANKKAPMTEEERLMRIIERNQAKLEALKSNK